MSFFILIVEDDEDLLPEMVEYLERRGFPVKGCGSLAAARQALETALTDADPPECVICDIGLPDGDGLRLLEEFAPRLAFTRWLLMSGSHDLDRLEVKLRAIPLAHPPMVIEKPFSLKDLRQFVEQ